MKDMNRKNAVQKGGGGEEDRDLLTDSGAKSPSTQDDPLDGRVHAGSGGGDDRHEVADDASYDPMPSPAEAYANTGQANTDPYRDASSVDIDTDAIDSNYPSVREDDARGDHMQQSRAGRSGVGRQKHSASDMEQPRGDGNSLRDGDRNVPIGGTADAGHE